MHSPFGFSRRAYWRWRVRRLARRLSLPSLVTAFTLLVGCAPMPAGGQPGAGPLSGDALPADPAWQLLAPGIEQRTFSPPAAFTQFVAVRLDPTRFTFRAHYQPGAPLSLDEWRAVLPAAAVIVNANFFDPDNRALGLLITDGAVMPTSSIPYGGVFGVLHGVPFVRPLYRLPASGPADGLSQAVQAFPVLIDGGVAQAPSGQGDRASRRTVIAQDLYGRIVVFTTPSLFGMRLSELSAYLISLDIGLVDAVNLDGGGSSMLSVRAGAAAADYPSFDRVPAVLAAYPIE